ncbi:MAG: fimbrillin family protein [Rikenellaceae bacterium]
MKRYILPILLVAFSLNTSCDDSSTEEGMESSESFDPQISAPQSTTMLLKSGFEEGDEVSLFAWDAADVASPTTEEFSLFNLQLTYDGSQWAPFDQDDFESVTDQSIMVAIYPSLLTTSELEDLTSVEIDIETPTIYSRAELSSWSESLSPTLTNVQAQLSFNVNGTAQTASNMNFTATVSTTASLNLISGETTTSAAESTTVTFAQNSTSSNLYSSLMIPQTITSFKITLSGSTYEYSGDGITLEAGASIIQNITLTAAETEGTIGEIELGDQFDISEWEAATGATGEFNHN